MINDFERKMHSTMHDTIFHRFNKIERQLDEMNNKEEYLIYRIITALIISGMVLMLIFMIKAIFII